ncbi:MAG: tetratricopeptide repeat protein [Robiginitomaculum sp.]|nr:tetratricopeptide repeat protein [Robiginitomaculum sp.]
MRFGGLLEDKRTRFAALRGLTETALQRHDHEGAIVHAKQAFAADPAAKWAFETLFDALIAARNWNEAREILSKGQSKGHLSKLSASRRRAVLLAAQSSNLEIDGDMESARKLAEKAVSAAPGFAPGAALASRLLVLAGKNWRAAGLLEDAWSNAPHPALSLAYGDLKEDESVTARAKRMRGLAQINLDHRESKILLAETALSSEENSEAREILEALIADEDAPSSRLCGLMARLERAQKNTPLANEWLRKSLTAADEADWSDLDPDGPAFGYRAEDWARLVYSFGDAGELIHPRHERFERISRGEEHFLLIESEAIIEDISESLEEEPIEIPEIPAIKITKPKKRTLKKPSAKKPKKKPEAKEPIKKKIKSKPVMADMPRQPDDPGPGAKADPTTSVLKRKRNAH